MFELGGRIRQHVDNAAPPIDLVEIQVRLSSAARGQIAREEPLLKKRSLTVFASAFAVVLLAGVAFASVGAFAPDEPVDNTPAATQEPGDVAERKPEATDKPAAADREEIAESDVPADDERAARDAKNEETPGEDRAVEPADEETDKTNDEPADTTPPEFVILHPSDGQRFETDSVVFEGEVEPGARVFAGDYEADVDESGNWRIVLILNAGHNVATLEALDAAGNVSADTVTIHYDVKQQPAEDGGDEEPPAQEPPAEEPPAEEPPAEEPPAEEPPAGEDEQGGAEPATVEFTANQQYGSCAEDVPYDVFWGSATPGATVYVVSDFGSGTTTANSDGQWEIRVEFPQAPTGQTFNVVIEADGGGRGVFTFVNTQSSE